MKIISMVNICIVHYNTPELTECLIKSINKFTPDSKIYIFDNSDKAPFTYKQDNIVYIDNTKNQIINFDEWLAQYTNKNNSNGKNNHFSSAKHCYTIEKCIELINDNFILLDSDILLKQDITPFFDNNFIYVGKSEYQTNCKNVKQHSIKRLLPYICFINVKKCKEKNIHYFDENYMNGLYVSEEGDLYDTGAGFLKNVEKSGLTGQEVNIYDYIVHCGAGSWSTTDKQAWLAKYKTLYKEDIIVSLTTHGNRIKHVIYALRSLVNQTLPANKIILNICKNDEKLITSELKSFADTNKIEIYLYNDDIGPHAKYFYTMKRFKYACIVTVDDDIKYPSDLIASLYADYLNNKNCIVARRVHKITYNKNIPLEYNKWIYEYKGSTAPGFDIFPTGVGGVLYPPNILKISDDCLPDIHKCLYADDIYLKYRSSELNIMSKWVKNRSLLGTPLNNKDIVSTGLALENNINKRNDQYIKTLKLSKHMPTNKIVVYTCITNNYDGFAKVERYPNLDYVCFTDNKSLQSDLWSISYIPEHIKHMSSVKQARYIKTHPHEFFKDYEISIWVDACIDIKANPSELINNSILQIPEHPVRKSIYEEQNACIKYKKDTVENINNQVNHYKEEGYPGKNGLVQSNIIIRKHNDPQCIKLMEDWWKEIETYSHRDQLSFNYVLWKNPSIKISLLDKKIYNSKYFFWHSNHKTKRIAVTVKSENTCNTSNYGGNYDFIGCKPIRRPVKKPIDPNPTKTTIIPHTIKRIFY